MNRRGRIAVALAAKRTGKRTPVDWVRVILDKLSYLPLRDFAAGPSLRHGDGVIGIEVLNSRAIARAVREAAEQAMAGRNAPREADRLKVALAVIRDRGLKRNPATNRFQLAW